MSRAELPPSRCLRASGLPINCYSHRSVRDWGPGDRGGAPGSRDRGSADLLAAGSWTGRLRSAPAPARTSRKVGPAPWGGASACALKSTGRRGSALWELAGGCFLVAPARCCTGFLHPVEVPDPVYPSCPQLIQDRDLRGNAEDHAAPPAALELLRDVHLGLAPPRRDPARLAVLSGHYLYYHYGCDGLDDRGWGCGYRTLQTLCSWPSGQAEGVPGLNAVQAALEDMGDKPPGFRGSRSWIGCVEASLCLAHFGGPQGRLCHVPRGGGLQGELQRLYSHFERDGGPVMVGGDADAQAKALLGVCVGPGTEAYVLILDPHYWGASKNPKELQAAGWVSWQEVSTAFDPTSFYNLCFTSRNTEK